MYTLSVQSDDPMTVAAILRKEIELLEYQDVFHSATGLPETKFSPAVTRVFMPSTHNCEGVCNCSCFR